MVPTFQASVAPTFSPFVGTRFDSDRPSQKTWWHEARRQPLASGWPPLIVAVVLCRFSAPVCEALDDHDRLQLSPVTDVATRLVHTLCCGGAEIGPIVAFRRRRSGLETDTVPIVVYITLAGCISLQPPLLTPLLSASALTGKITRR